MPEVIYSKNDNLLELRGLANAATGNYENAATVTATVVDSTDTEVPGLSWPLTLAYVAASDGDYRGEIGDGASFVVGTDYTAKITATVSGGPTGYWEIPLTVLTRKS